MTALYAYRQLERLLWLSQGPGAPGAPASVLPSRLSVQESECVAVATLNLLRLQVMLH